MKTVLVTGGTVRLGLAIAERLRRDGWRVVVSSHRPDAGADLVADLSVASGAARLYADALQLLEGRPPDALVNNAALFRGDDAVVRQLNLESPRKLTFMMSLREGGIGTVVNVADCAALGYADPAGESAYLAAKRELLADTVKYARLFAATLRVNAVAPGAVLAPAGFHLEAGERLLERRPTAEDVADAVAFLLGAESVTGLVLPVDGGQSLLESV